MVRVGLHKGFHTQRITSIASTTLLRSRISSTLVQPRPGFRPRPLSKAILPSPRSVRCFASSPDPDSYEHDLEYDSDDYELLEAAAAAPRTAAHRSNSASPSSSGKFDVTAQNAQFSSSKNASAKDPRTTREAIRTGFNIFLLFGAAIDRFVSRIQAASFAAGIAMLAFLRKALKTTGKNTQKIRQKAAESFSSSPVGQKIDRWGQNITEVKQELPDDMWGKLLWLWDRPPVQRLRLTVSMANLSIRLPALLALVATQVGLLASQVSLPMLAPLLLGTGMMLRSIKANASFLLPRIGLLVVMLWMLWFMNSVVHNTVAYCRAQGMLDSRIAGGIITVSECATLLIAFVVLLTMLGVNVSALLLPAGIAVAIAAKDLSHNFLAGLFLFVVQPFKLGDRMSISSSAPGVGGPAGGWFEGVCEKVDLRYVIVRQGRRRLMVPNSAFLTREFMVLDDGPVGNSNEPPPPPWGMAVAGEQQFPQEYLTQDYRHVWQYVDGPPVHQELARSAYPPTMPAGSPPPPPLGSERRREEEMNAEYATASGANNGMKVNGPSSGSSNGMMYPPPQQQQQQYYPPQPNTIGTTSGGNYGMNEPARIQNSYWQHQQQQQRPYGSYYQQQPPQQRPYGVSAHPLSPEAWHQSSASSYSDEDPRTNGNSRQQ